MKPFSERNLVLLGVIALGVTVLITVLSLNYHKLPFINTAKSYSAYFAEAGGLKPNAVVQVSGMDVGRVTSVDLDGPRVLVKFEIAGDVSLGDRTEAAIKLASTLGTKLLEIAPRGQEQLGGPIPLERTTPAYQLTDALGDLSTTVKGIDTDQLSNSLDTLSQELADTPPAVRAAVQGVGRLSDTLGERDEQLRSLLDNAEQATHVLAERSDKVLSLVNNANALLAELNTQRSALDNLAINLSSVAHQLKGFIEENRATLKPALDKLNGVLAIVDNRKERVQKALKQLISFAQGLGESVSAQPGFKANVLNLPPGQFIQPFIDAAFSDLGLDPSTLPPAQLSDPPVGQPATPPLPIPYPRTGQGGEPRLTIPDAITGNAGDQGCGPPGLPLPGPTGCYPLRQEPPAPPPGGPPPGPPAIPLPPSVPTPVYVPAPGEVPPATPPLQPGDGQQ